MPSLYFQIKPSLTMLGQIYFLSSTILINIKAKYQCSDNIRLKKTTDTDCKYVKNQIVTLRNIEFVFFLLLFFGFNLFAQTNPPTKLYLISQNQSNELFWTASPDTVNIVQETPVPEASAGGGGSIIYTVISIIIACTSPTSGVTYSRPRSNNFISTLQNPSFSIPGIYTLSVINPVNSYSSDKTINVLHDKTKPNVSVYSNMALTCCTKFIKLLNLIKRF
jgi:hypothetical protein